MGIYLPCDTCREKRRCPDYETMCAAALWAFGRGDKDVECKGYAPKWERGVDGVLDYDRRSPRPSRGYAKQRFHHGARL
jgi:hypothetical protein